MDRLPTPNLPPGPRRDLSDALHALHRRAGWPSLRALSRAVGCSHSTVSAMFSSPRLPTWGLLELLVETLDGDVDTFRLLWVAASTGQVTSGAAPSRSRTGRLAGRGSEFALLAEHARVSDEGLVMVCGEAGIGKSALVRAVGDEISPEVFVAAGFCLPRGRELTLLPVSDVFRAVFRADGGRWLDQALSDSYPYARGELARLLPELAPDSVPGFGGQDPLARTRQFAAISAAFGALAARRPLVVVFEDLHWADLTTLELLDFLLAAPNRAGVSMIGTFRTDEHDLPAAVESWRVRLSTLPAVETVVLGRLSLSETAGQIAGLTGAPVNQDVLQRVYKRSQGHPLFTELLVTHGDGPDLPVGVAELLDRRFGDLSPAAWAVCRTLATLERPLTADQLTTLARLDTDALTRALRELAGRHLVLAEPGGSQVAFRHPLLADAVRRRMVPAETTSEHAWAARVSAGWPGVAATEVAGHWQVAGRPRKESRWRARAAREAERCYAYADAAEQWMRVLALWPAGGSAEADKVALLDAYCAAMDALEAAGDPQAAAELAEVALARIEPGTPAAVSAGVHRRAGALIGITDPARGVGLLQQALAGYGEAGVRPGRLRALSQLAALYRGQGRHRDAGAVIAEAAALVHLLDAPELRRSILASDAWHRMEAGDIDGARTQICRAAEGGSRRSVTVGEVWRTAVHTDILLKAGGTTEETDEASRSGLAAIRELGLTTFAASLVLSNVSQLRVRAGRVSSAAELIDPRTEGETTLSAWAEHLERARLDLLRGRLDAAGRRLVQLTALPITSLSFRAEIALTQAEWLLWTRRPRDALRVALSVLRDTAPTAESRFAGALLTTAARAAADRVQAGAPGGRDLAALQRLRADCASDPFAAGGSIPYDAGAWAATWFAEIARLRGVPDPGPWARAVGHWDALARPLEAAYCRWRLAQLLAASGVEGPRRARTVLRRARVDAREHQLLLGAMDAVNDALR